MNGSPEDFKRQGLTCAASSGTLDCGLLWDAITTNLYPSLGYIIMYYECSVEKSGILQPVFQSQAHAAVGTAGEDLCHSFVKL